MLEKETRRNIALGIAILMALSSILVTRAAAADGEINLPPHLVNVEVSNGTESYFITSLTGVPSGYDVINTTYPGWCIDRTANMTRGILFEVLLYSSINPPGNLSSVRWNMVNYILNHKQGNADDIQQAIWYFANLAGNYTPTSPVAMNMVNDAVANGTDFIPTTDNTEAIICFPVVLFPELYPVQVSIIELQVPVIPEFPSVTIPLLIALTTLSAVIIRKRNFIKAKANTPW